jgi:hypothetical protein
MTRDEKLKSFAQAHALNGMVFCGRNEDLPIDQELRSEILRDQEPWYEQFTEQHLNNLFTEDRNKLPVNKFADFDLYHSIPSIFHERETKNKQ